MVLSRFEEIYSGTWINPTLQGTAQNIAAVASVSGNMTCYSRYLRRIDQNVGYNEFWE